MKLEKAIEILARSASDGIPRGETAFNDAVKLGIEALKRIKLQRSPRGFGYSYRLPGETPE